MISCDGIVKYWHIADDSIVVSKGAIQKEKSHLAFVAPLIECVVYQDSQIGFYFEYGKYTNSHEDLPDRKKYREEWLKIIRRELAPIIDSH